MSSIMLYNPSRWQSTTK